MVFPLPSRYPQSFASRQSQSYNSRSGSYQSGGFSITSRQCSAIRRFTRYEKVNVPFLCHVLTGRVMPVPRVMHPSEVQLLGAMQA